MVVTYKNKFVKVFISFLFCLAALIITILYESSLVYKLTTQSTNTPFAVIKYLNYLTIFFGILTYTLYFYCHYLLAKAKGYSSWLTLLAFINTFGLLILFLLPDKRRKG